MKQSKSLNVFAVWISVTISVCGSRLVSGLDPNSMGFLDPYPDPVTINKINVADPDPGSDAFLTPGPDPGYRIGFFPDPGSQPHIF
jgi:hypothetical protein